MSDNVPTSEQVSRATRLIGLLCDAPNAGKEMAELDELVVQFPQIRRRYVELMSMNADIRQQATFLRTQDSTDSAAANALIDLAMQKTQSESTVAGSAFAPAPHPSSTDLNETLILPAIRIDDPESVAEGRAIDLPLTIASPKSQKSAPWRLVAAIIMPLLTLSIFWSIRGRSGSGLHVSPVPSPQCIVNLSMSARFADPEARSPSVGSALNLGTYNLTSGLIKLELPGNAMVVIEAPARFEVLSSKELRLSEGKLCALLVKGGGLTVVTPDMTAVDLGTEFALDVAAGEQTHLEVFQGAVRAATTNLTSADASKSVVAGEAVMVAKGSAGIEKDTPRPLAFVRPGEVQAVDATSYQRWSRFSQAIREDQDLTAYYPFDAESAAAGRLENRAKQTVGTYTGTLGVFGVQGSNPKWIHGRWPGKSALQFGPGQLTGVTIDAQPALIPNAAMTLCCWIKRAELDKPFHLLAGEAEGGRSFNLGVIGRENGGPADIINSTWSQFNVASAPAPFKANEWEFICIVSTLANESDFYLNGKLISVNKSPSSTPVVVKQLVIGASVPGNMLSSKEDFFTGSMDELMIFHRVLSGKEIEHLFSMGLPD